MLNRSGTAIEVGDSVPSEIPPSRRRWSIALVFGFLLFAASGWVVCHNYLRVRHRVSLLDEFWSASPQSRGSFLLLKENPAKVNFEAVTSTEVIEGNPGRPVIVAIAKL